MLAQDDPNHIQILRNGEQIYTENEMKILTYVDAYDTMRPAAREEFVKKMIPDKLRLALKEREKRKIAGS